MEPRTKPKLDIAKRVLPPQLFKVLESLMQNKCPGVLVGGTALSGFYTAHRRSDDIDLFTQDESSQKATVYIVKNLKNISVEFHNETTSAYYYHANCSLNDHRFTIDVVMDKNLFQVGDFHLVNQNFKVASLETLLRMKSAALVSRASEKNLSDLIKLFAIFINLSISRFIELGASIDAGVNSESMLASLAGTTLRKESCDFSISPNINKDDVYKEIKSFSKRFIVLLQNHLKNQEAPPLKDIIKLAKKILK